MESFENPKISGGDVPDVIASNIKIEKMIGRGGMGTVYRATHLSLDRTVAVKVMHGHLADDSEYKARFIQEARSAARLAHPNVVNVYDQGQDADTAYLVMELLEGTDLESLLASKGALDEGMIIDIMVPIIAGVNGSISMAAVGSRSWPN